MCLLYNVQLQNHIVEHNLFGKTSRSLTICVFVCTNVFVCVHTYRHNTVINGRCVDTDCGALVFIFLVNLKQTSSDRTNISHDSSDRAPINTSNLKIS